MTNTFTFGVEFKIQVLNKHIDQPMNAIVHLVVLQCQLWPWYTVKMKTVNYIYLFVCLFF